MTNPNETTDRLEAMWSQMHNQDGCDCDSDYLGGKYGSDAWWAPFHASDCPVFERWEGVCEELIAHGRHTPEEEEQMVEAATSAVSDAMAEAYMVTSKDSWEATARKAAREALKAAGVIEGRGEGESHRTSGGTE